jgi:hypothetical protein
LDVDGSREMLIAALEELDELDSYEETDIDE